MNDKPFSCTIDDCGKRFATLGAKNDHRRMKHGRRPKRPARTGPLADVDRDHVYELVESMDLPDGAHWAMIQELSGLEPGDFA